MRWSHRAEVGYSTLLGNQSIFDLVHGQPLQNVLAFPLKYVCTLFCISHWNLFICTIRSQEMVAQFHSRLLSDIADNTSKFPYERILAYPLIRTITCLSNYQGVVLTTLQSFHSRDRIVETISKSMRLHFMKQFGCCPSYYSSLQVISMPVSQYRT